MKPLLSFCRAVDRIIIDANSSAEAARHVAADMPAVLEDDAWLPDAWAAPSQARYQQHLLYRDPEARFSVVSFVWGPGQRTPIHDHGVWGVVGVLRGAESSTRYALSEDGGLQRGGLRTLARGDIEVLDPEAGDIHAVENALQDDVSVSIHAYGADIGALPRRTFDPDGTPHPFVSRYSDVPALLERLYE